MLFHVFLFIFWLFIIDHRITIVLPSYYESAAVGQLISATICDILHFYMIIFPVFLTLFGLQEPVFDLLFTF